MSPRSVRTAVFVVALMGCLRGTARAADQVLEWSGNGKAVSLWIPDGVTVVRGIIVDANPAGGDSRTQAGKTPSINWANLARALNFSVLGTSGFDNNAFGADGQALLAALSDMAKKAGRKELENAPFLATGFSNGGQFAYELNAWKPNRTIAFNCDKGGFYQTYMPTEAALHNPGFIISGAVDTETRKANIARLWTTNRPRGALWAFLEQEGTGHATNGSQDFLATFFARAVARRYPANESPLDGPVKLLEVKETEGWLIDNASWKSGKPTIGSYADYKGDARAAGWLLDETVAVAFRALATYGTVSALTRANQDAFVKAGSKFTEGVDVSKLATGWTKVELFRDLVKLGEITQGGSTTVDGEAPSSGVYALHAVATFAGGSRYIKTRPLWVSGPGGTPDTKTDAGEAAPVRDAGAQPTSIVDARSVASLEPDAGVGPPATLDARQTDPAPPAKPKAPDAAGKPDDKGTDADDSARTGSCSTAAGGRLPGPLTALFVVVVFFAAIRTRRRQSVGAR